MAAEARAVRAPALPAQSGSGAGRSTSKACDDRRRGPRRPPPKLVRRGRLDLPAGFLVRLDGLLEVAVLLAAEEAQAVEPREGLLGLREGVERQGGLADVLVGAEVAWIERQRLLVERDGLCRVAAAARGVGQPVPRVGVVGGPLHSTLQQRDRARELPGLDALHARRVLGRLLLRHRPVATTTTTTTAAAVGQRKRRQEQDCHEDPCDASPGCRHDRLRCNVWGPAPAIKRAKIILRSMPPARVRIISVPPGEAPADIRRAWVGLTLPIVGRGPMTGFGTGVLTGPKSILELLWRLVSFRMQVHEGYAVDVATGIDMLAKARPDAAAWWRHAAPHLFRRGHHFVFARDCCQPVEEP